LRQGGTPSDVADLAYSSFSPPPPEGVLPPHPDPPEVQLHQPSQPAPQTLQAAIPGEAPWTHVPFVYHQQQQQEQQQEQQHQQEQEEGNKDEVQLYGYGWDKL